MTRVLLVTFFAALAFTATVLTAPVHASGFVLHPAGFGANSYAAWKGGEGLPDNTGNSNQALYFQKLTSTSTFAAGVAIITGFAGLSSTDISDLKFWWGGFPLEGHCGAGAPRFNVRLQFTSGVKENFFSGCSSGMVHDFSIGTGLRTAPNGRVFEHKHVLCYFPSGIGPIPSGTCAPLPSGWTVVSIAIVFDEGTDQGTGFVFLDNIEVDSESTGTHLWTSAADNGNSDPSASTTIFDTSVIEALLGAPLTSLSIP